MTYKVQAVHSTLVDTEKTTVISVNRETCVRLIQDLAEGLGQVGVGRLVLRTTDDRFLIFKVDP